jgi:hypothetical protein
MRMKEIMEQQWRRCLEIDIKLVDTGEELTDMKQELLAEEIVDRFQLLRDCWQEIAGEGLL